MNLKFSMMSGVCALLAACPPVPAPVCDAGATTPEVRLRVVNLGREAVTVQLDGEDAGTAVLPLASKNYVGHVTLIKQRGTVEARTFLPDGGREPVVLPFEFDATADEDVTFVVRDQMPTRLSTNFTVARQTQGATFGEKVQAGLANVEIEGGVDTGGDCAADLAAPAGTLARTSLRDDGAGDCDGTLDAYFVRPLEVSADAAPYFVHGEAELLVAWVDEAKVNAGLHAAGGALAQGASLLGGALPGGAVISAAVRNVSVLNAHGAMQAATVSLEGVTLAQDVAPGALVRVRPAALAQARGKLRGKVRSAGDTGMLASFTVGGVTQVVTLGAVLTGPCKPPYLCDELNDEDTLLVVSENVDASATVLKSARKGWDGTVKGGRREVVAATTSLVETRGCVAAFPGDDTCVMGVTAVSAVGNLAGGAGGGAAAASYAATGRLLWPPAKGVGTEPARFVVQESSTPAQRFTWLNPPGLTPVQGKAAGGFAIVSAGTAVDASATTQRALWYVDTTVTPWALARPALSDKGGVP